MKSPNQAKKSLGQHWLKDEQVQAMICDAADLQVTVTVLEIGPGLGDLTRQLLKRAGKVIAVELDEHLAKNLPHHIPPISKNASRKAISKDGTWKGELEVVEGDILLFDLGRLPLRYKVVANIPYYLSSILLRVLGESANPPDLMVLLVQKEVAMRIAARPGRTSLLSV